MNKKYCPSCNNPLFYEEKTPNLCSNCGYTFASIPKIEIQPILQKPKKRIVTRQIEEEIDDENNNNLSQSNFNIPKIEIETPDNLRQKETLGNLALDKSPRQNLKRPKLKKMKIDEFTKEWSKEIVRNRNQSHQIGGSDFNED